MSLLILLLPQLTPGARQGFAAKTATSQLANALRTARGAAVTSDQETRLVFDPHARTYRIEPRGDTRTLRAEISLSFRGPVDQASDTVAIIRFFPDGSSTGGEFQVTSPGGARHKVTLHTLSGRVTIDE